MISVRPRMGSSRRRASSWPSRAWTQAGCTVGDGRSPVRSSPTSWARSAAIAVSIVSSSAKTVGDWRPALPERAASSKVATTVQPGAPRRPGRVGPDPRSRRGIEGHWSIVRGGHTRSWRVAPFLAFSEKLAAPGTRASPRRASRILARVSAACQLAGDGGRRAGATRVPPPRRRQPSTRNETCGRAARRRAPAAAAPERGR